MVKRNNTSLEKDLKILSNLETIIQIKNFRVRLMLKPTKILFWKEYI
jgi:hypothetical protein